MGDAASEAARRDRARGALVGLAVGDAVGAPVEFDAPEEIVNRREELFSMPGGGMFGWAPGEFTDDTQMALLLGRHLREHGGRIRQDTLVRSFADWAEDAIDVGNQTRSVLFAVTRGVPWRSAVAALPADASGNGSLMRVTPVALAAHSAEHAVELARAQSELTHESAACLDCCAVFARLLWNVLETGALAIDEALSGPEADGIGNTATRFRLARAPQMSGWVIRTLTGALWAMHGATSFEDVIWRAVSLGRDADTVGAVAGALAGSYYGLHAIPDSLSRRLQSQHRLFREDYPDALIELADALLACRSTAPNDRQPDTPRGGRG
jgi:ADP-ribosylglycohydrolase